MPGVIAEYCALVDENLQPVSRVHGPHRRRGAARVGRRVSSTTLSWAKASARIREYAVSLRVAQCHPTSRPYRAVVAL